MSHDAHGQAGRHGRPYRLFWINMALGLVVMYVVMFSMIDTGADFHHNLNMAYMAITMWAPMGTSCWRRCRACIATSVSTPSFTFSSWC